MEEIAEVLRQYSLEAVILALVINLSTALCKIPIKALARKAKNSASITRFIVFMPIILGFALTVCYAKWFVGSLVIDKEFMQLWLTSSSLSLTFYAVFEKLMPSKNKAENDAAIKASKEVLDKIQSAVNGVEGTGQETKTDDEQTNKEETYTACSENAKSTTKIILRGKRDDKTE